jgi:Xaa-Pro aminopeptidase
MITPRRPTLTLADRDRRWARIRRFLDEQGLDGLVVGGFRGREWYETYVSDEAIQGAVVFPRSGAPVYLTWSGFRIVGRDDPQNDRQYWIKDIRAGLIGPCIVQAVKDLGLSASRIGVVGIDAQQPMEPEGYIPYGVWSRVLGGLPKAQFVEVSAPFGILAMQKSEAELEVARYCAKVGEHACQAMLDAARPGVSESEIYTAIVSEIHRHALTLTQPAVIVKSGWQTISWGPPEWGVGSAEPRTVAAGELVIGELMPTYAGIETQQQMTIALGPVAPEVRRLADLARRSYDAGLQALRPGITFFELCERMAKPVLESGAWHLSPMIHSMSPACLLGALHGGADKVFHEEYPWFRPIPPNRDAVLEEGMLFSFEPNACEGRVRVNIGGTVAIGKSGPEEMNSLSCRMHEVS